MSTSFSQLLHITSEDVERPRLIADGHYIGTIVRHEFGNSRNKQTPYVRFFLTPSEETSDVPEGANAGIDLAKQEAFRDFYLTPKSLFMLTDMLDAVLGKQMGRFADERLPETRDARVMFEVKHRDSEDGVRQFYDIGAIVAVPAQVAQAA